MASAVLVTGLTDASTTCIEFSSLFESVGTVTQTLVLTPAQGGIAAVLVCFATSGAAREAASLFDSHPHAGTFLEVKVADPVATGRLLAALAEVQAKAAGGGQAVAPAPPLRSDSASMLGLAAAPAPYAAANGGGHPSPAPFTAPAPTPSEPPAFGGAGYNAADWEVPADDPLPPTSGWASAASEPRRAAAPAPSAAGRPAAAAPQAQAPAQGNLPEWEVDKRCRIFISHLRPGLTADDLKSHFSRFGPLVDASVVPKQQIGFLTFRHASDGEACLHATHGCTVPGLSPPGGSAALSLEFRDIDKIKRHLSKTNRRPDVVQTPTTRVFIGYFPRSTKQRDVEPELARFGEIDNMMLGGGQDGGELYCFVQYRYVRDAKSCFEALQGRTMPSLAGGRQLVCAYKEPRGGR